MPSGKCKGEGLWCLQAILVGLIAQLGGKLQLPEFVLNCLEENGLNKICLWHCFLSGLGAQLFWVSPSHFNCSKLLLLPTLIPGTVCQEGLLPDVLTAHLMIV